MAHGLKNVLDTAEHLLDRPDIAFLLAGAGSEREELIADAAQRELTNVIFMDPQPKDKMPAVWSLCRVALVHLRKSVAFKEVIPSKMFEAMGMGLPIILALPAGEASAILDANGAGLHVLPENSEALAQAVIRLADDPDLCQSLADRSFAAAPKYSRETQADHMISVLQAVVDGDGDMVSEIPVPESVDARSRDGGDRVCWSTSLRGVIGGRTPS